MKRFKLDLRGSELVGKTQQRLTCSHSCRIPNSACAHERADLCLERALCTWKNKYWLSCTQNCCSRFRHPFSPPSPSSLQSVLVWLLPKWTSLDLPCGYDLRYIWDRKARGLFNTANACVQCSCRKLFQYSGERQEDRSRHRAEALGGHCGGRQPEFREFAPTQCLSQVRGLFD